MNISNAKKLAAVTAAFFITVTAFSGCSESANSSQTTSSVSQAAKSLKAGSEVNISGGDFKIDSADDSVHSNGNIVITRGTLIACGAVGMEEGFGDSSTQYSVLHDLGSTVSANEKLTITDSDGKEILSFTPTKTWQSVVFTSADLKEGETYTITAGSQSETVTIDGIVTSNSKGMSFGRGHGGGRSF